MPPPSIARALLLRKVVGHKSERMQLTYTSAEKAEVIDLAQRLGGALRGAKRGSQEPS